MTGFRKGDRVRWNSEVGVVSGVVLKKHTQDVEFQGRMRRCSPDDPQYEIRSEKTGKEAVHTARVLRRLD